MSGKSQETRASESGKINPIHEQPDTSGNGDKLRLIEELANAPKERIPEILRALRHVIRKQGIQIRTQTLQNLTRRRDALHARIMDPDAEEQSVMRANLGDYMNLIDADRDEVQNTLNEGSVEDTRPAASDPGAT